MGKIVKRLITLAVAVAVALAIIPFTKVEQPVAATESIAVPDGGFNTGNTSTSEDSEVRISGAATLDGKGGVLIVPQAGQQRGGVFSTNPIKTHTGFSASFKMFLGQGSGQIADGFTFIMAKATNQVGATGQGIGYGGIKNSIAIEFDTYDNKLGGGNGTVPHIWYGMDGSMDTSDNNRLVVFEPVDRTADPVVSKFRNKKDFHVYGWVEFNADKSELYVTYSSTPTRPDDYTLVLANGAASGNHWDGETFYAFDPKFNDNIVKLGDEFHVGFTSATGGSMQAVTLQSFSAYGEYTEPGDSKIIYIDDTPVDVGTGINLPDYPPADPTGEQGKFRGYFHRDTGVQYYDEKGKPVNVNDLDAGEYLVSRFSYTIKLRNQGVADGVLEVDENAPLPLKSPVPVQLGYDFLGYYDDISGDAIQYYDANGNITAEAIAATPLWKPFDKDNPDNTGPATLYAMWVRQSIGVDVNLAGGNWENANVPKELEAVDYQTYTTTENLQGGAMIKIPRPSKTGYAFTGWTVSGGGGFMNGDLLTASGDASITLTANWLPITPGMAQVVYDVEGKIETLPYPELLKAFETYYLVDDGDYGVTAGDLEIGSVALVLHVRDVHKDDLEFKPDTDAISGMAEESFSKGALEKLTFYEIYLEKIITDELGDEISRTLLKGLPWTVTAEIPMPDDIKGFSGYTIFQRYDGIVGDISAFGGGWHVVADDLELDIMNFSVLGVLPNGKHIHFERTPEQDDWDDAISGGLMDANGRFRFPDRTKHATPVGNWDDLNVQGRIVELKSPTYHLEIEWGEMKFVFSLDYVWDPITHEYDTGEKVNDWAVTPDSAGFNGVNNQIIVTNKSNDGVVIDFTTKKEVVFLNDVNVEVLKGNLQTALPALGIPLERVPVRGGTANQTEAFLRMWGNPDIDDFKQEYEDAKAANGGSDAWLRIATITVTVKPMGKLHDLTP